MTQKISPQPSCYGFFFPENLVYPNTQRNSSKSKNWIIRLWRIWVGPKLGYLIILSFDRLWKSKSTLNTSNSVSVGNEIEEPLNHRMVSGATRYEDARFPKISAVIVFWKVRRWASSSIRQYPTVFCSSFIARFDFHCSCVAVAWWRIPLATCREAPPFDENCSQGSPSCFLPSWTSANTFALQRLILLVCHRERRRNQRWSKRAALCLTATTTTTVSALPLVFREVGFEGSMPTI